MLLDPISVSFLIASLLATGLSVPSSGGRDALPRGEDSVALVAAQLELLVLGATLPDSVSTEGANFVLSRRSPRLTKDETARALAGLPKPVICSILVGSDRAIEIECKPVETPHELAVYKATSQTGEWIVQTAGRKGPPTPRGRIIMVRCSGEAMLVPEDAFVRWFRDYASNEVVAFSHGMPREEDEGEASYVVRVHRVGPVDLDGIPPDTPPSVPPGALPNRPRKPF